MPEPLLALEGVEARYGPVKALHGVSLTVAEGEIVAVLGANGAGKTTTLRAISGTVRRSGAIRFAGRSIAGRSPVALARALMLRPRLVLLDEPSLGLAPRVVAEIFRIVGELNERDGLTVLVVEQNAILALEAASRAYVLEVGGVARWFWSSETRTIPNAFSTRPITVAGVAFSIQDLGNIAVSLGVVALLAVLFQFTKLGLALRAAAVNPEESRLLGIRVSWMLALGWGLAASMGAVSGMLTAPALASFDQNL